MSDSQEAIAIIGMSGRFPGAKNVEEFWYNLRNGVESISFFSQEELESAGIAQELVRHSDYVKANSIIDNIEWFDAAFFGINPKEAAITDPQQRLFLECAWEALEQAGYESETYCGSIGVYAGTGGLNSYYLNNLYPNSDLRKSVGDYQIMIANDSNLLSTRVSYKLNLTGPSLTIQTACSTSLVAISMACRSLLNYECDLALAGGVSLRVPQKTGYLYQEGMILSPDGHCRAFDAKAQGTVGGSGVGIVVLKRLEEAIADRDYIHAVIKGCGINNDGANKVGLTAPSVDGQAAVISQALAFAEVEPETITYIEAHGTATPMGDPIEIAALTQVFSHYTQKKSFCALGSVKTNIGHLDSAAGVAGLIKTVCALKHKLIPPTLHFEESSPEIDFANSPFYVNTKLSEWKTQRTPRRAGVSSFGVGGTNAHVILEEAPVVQTSEQSRPWQLLMLSAKTDAALESATVNLVEHLKEHPKLNLADVAYTLSKGRKAFDYRRILVCRTREDAIAALSTHDSQRVLTNFQESIKRRVVFMFSGQGSQYVNMALELYQVEPTFSDEIDRCSRLLKPHLNFDLRNILYPNSEQVEKAAEQLQQTALAQPALFVIEYALAKLWMSWGVHPTAMIGHSIGEYVAACLAGVFSLEDALFLVATRGQLMQQLPSGSMLAVPLSEQQVQSLLDEETFHGTSLQIAAINGLCQCVVSGVTEAVNALLSKLLEQGVECRRLQTSHAFHSGMMEPILEPFTLALKKINLKAPNIPYLSNVTGSWITADEATNPSYWTKHLRSCVRFADGLQQLFQQADRILLEVGPGRTLSTLAKQHQEQADGRLVLSSLRHPKDEQSDITFLLTTLGKLWLAGVQIDWSEFYTHERRHRIPLPTYPFERQRYWIEPKKYADTATFNDISLHKKPDIADWFYIPSWKRSILPVKTKFTPSLQERDITKEKLCWLVFIDACGLGSQLVKQLEQNSQDVTTVMLGEQFTRHGESVYTINPRKRDDYDALLKELHALNKAPKTIVHLWSVTPNADTSLEIEFFEKSQYLGFYSLLFLAQALGEQNLTDPLQIVVVSNNMQEVTGVEALCPEKATVLGPCRVIPQEYPHITCKNIDIVISESETWDERGLLGCILSELAAPPSNLVVAYRETHRWVQTFEPLKLEESVKETLQLRSHGVYLITGGLGGIGLVLAEYLAKTVQARLVLIGRSAFPRKDQWETWLATHDAQDEVSRKIRKLQVIENLGAEVLIKSADVANLEQMLSAITQAYECFGEIHGVIHAAGIVKTEFLRTIQETSQVECSEQFQAKVRGLFVLKKVLQGRALDFCLLTSSLSSVLGGLGFVAYSAANLFMDAFAYICKQTGTPWISTNWDGWKLQEEKKQNIALGHTLAKLVITPTEGVEVFQRLLSISNPVQVVVSTGDLQARVDQWIKRESLGNTKSPKKVDSSSLHLRPNLHNAYVAPKDDVEQTLANIWQEFLGIRQVGVHDEFFELGGHSLLAVQLMARIEQQFKKNLPLATLFQNSTIERLATILRQPIDDLDWSALVPIQPNGSKRPFFCVPGAGGNTIYLYNLAHHLGKDQPFYGLQSLGLDGKSKPYTKIEDMAASYIEAIQSIQPSGPYLLGGHSFGGKVAFEMATQLHERGYEVALLALLDAGGPGYRINELDIDGIDDAGWLKKIASVVETFYGKSLNVSDETLKVLAPEEQLNYFKEQLQMVNFLPPDVGIKQAHGLIQVFKTNSQTASVHMPQAVYPAQITFFRASEEIDAVSHANSETLEEELGMGWDKFSAQPLDIHLVPGDHITMLSEPHVQVLAQQLTMCIERSQADD
ncbi:hypothetical protein AMR41_08275 [Hapalosiphon sp. MRB220]|nr:hypothetical protein AMR41_08275 [Hapalosiphon sp. MRB220]